MESNLARRPRVQMRALVPASVATFSAVGLLTFALVAPWTPAPTPSVALYALACAAMTGVAVAYRPSFFVGVLVLFLALGFPAKSIAHFAFGEQLIEPVGSFNFSSEAWETAFHYAASGLFGVAAGGIVCGLFPSFRPAVPWTGNTNILWVVLTAGFAISCGLYLFNYEFHILRIGYPLLINLHGSLYPILAFAIAWGALLGGLTLMLWLVEANSYSSALLIYAAAVLGFLASLTMLSRVQFLLYIFTAVLVIAARWRRVTSWRPIAVSMIVAGVAFVGSIGVVSIERNYSFQPIAAKAEAAPSLIDKADSVVESGKLSGLVQELKSLVIMRWVGLEGVMVTASSNDLSLDLFKAAIRENPAAGKNGIYQVMAGSQYREVKNFEFLTLPGPISVLSFAGSSVFIFLGMALLVIICHSIEWFAVRVTRNLAAGGVAGVSLAYLVVQMGFPRTLFVYWIELMIAAAMIGILRYALDQVSRRSSDQSHIRGEVEC